MSRSHKSIETRHHEERDSFFADLARLNALSRRGFLRIAGLSAGIAAAKGLVTPASFQLVEMAHAQGTAGGGDGRRFSFAYISDTHLYKKELNDRFVRAILKAVDDVNA